MAVTRSSRPPALRRWALSQNDLAKLTGIAQATISASENDRVRLGVERARTIARALKCHPAVLVFPGWDVTQHPAP